MRLGMTSRHEISKTPVAVFEGDEEISAQTYRQLMSGGYSAITAYLTTGSRAAGVQLDPTTEERWRRISCAAYYIDDFIDSTPDSAQAHTLYQQSMSAALSSHDVQQTARTIPGSETADPLLVPSIIALKNSVIGSQPGKLQRLQQSALTINDAALQKATSSSVEDYIHILNRESDAMVDLYDYSATDTVLQQTAYPRFSRTLRDIMRVAVFGDSTFDLQRDYEQGIVVVKPTPQAIARLALQSISPALRASRQPMTWQMLLQVRPRIIRD